MTPAEVRQAVIDRLQHHKGIPHNTAHGEPVWALLLSSFSYWRETAEQLLAVDAALAQCVPAAYAAQNWSVVRDGCDFAVALIDQPDGWSPPSCQTWPDRSWLENPMAAVGKVDAAIAALHLLRHTRQLDIASMDRLFRAACTAVQRDPKRESSAWLIECWKVRVSQEGSKERGLNIPLFDMFLAAQRLPESSEREHLVRAAISWAWLLFKPKERVGLAAAVRKVIEDFDDVGYREILFGVEEEEFPEKWTPPAWRMDAKAIRPNNIRPVDRLRSVSASIAPDFSHRMSTSWQACPA